MAIMNRCCCCGVRGGSTASGWYTLIFGALYAAVFGYAYSAIDFLDKFLSEGNSLSNGTLGYYEGAADGIIETVRIWVLVFLIFSSLVVVCSVLLLIGICNDARYMFIPWMIMTGISALLKVADVVALGVLTNFNPAIIGGVIGAVLFLALDIYCILCVISHFQNLGEGITGLEPQTTVVVNQNQIGAPPGYQMQQQQPMQRRY